VSARAGRLLMVGADPATQSALGPAFAAQGFAVDDVGDVAAALDRARWGRLDAVVADAGDTGDVGLDLCRKLRAMGRPLAIILLSREGSARYRVAALDAGADDCMTSPVVVAELLARLRGLLRRAHWPRAETPPLTVGRLRLDTAALQFTVDGARLDLTPREFVLLQVLIENADEPVAAGEIAERVWGRGDAAALAALPVHVHGLRRRLDSVGARDLVRTVRGVGYMVSTSGPLTAFSQENHSEGMER
jgi:DNA-binding response OmpR family regulator